MVVICVCVCEPALALHACCDSRGRAIAVLSCGEGFVTVEVPIAATRFAFVFAMVSLPVLSMLSMAVAGEEGRFAQVQAHSGFVIKVQAPKEADAEVLASLDDLMRSAQGERAAADAEFAASKSKMLAAERAEVQRIVRGSRR